MQDIQAPDILERLPEAEVLRRLGVKERSLRLVRERKVFPANWYLEIKAICREQGVECPEHVFNWKSPSSGGPSSSEVAR